MRGDRLNDMVAGAPSVVPQMRHRAEVARAACPELLIDTDDWPMPDKRSWRAFLDVKPDLGVPSLYFATHVADTAEELDADDYAAIEAAWGEWKKRAT